MGSNLSSPISIGAALGGSHCLVSRDPTISSRGLIKKKTAPLIQCESRLIVTMPLQNFVEICPNQVLVILGSMVKEVSSNNEDFAIYELQHLGGSG